MKTRIAALVVVVLLLTGCTQAPIVQMIDEPPQIWWSWIQGGGRPAHTVTFEFTAWDDVEITHFVLRAEDSEIVVPAEYDYTSMYGGSYYSAEYDYQFEQSGWYLATMTAWDSAGHSAEVRVDSMGSPTGSPALWVR